MKTRDYHRSVASPLRPNLHFQAYHDLPVIELVKLIRHVGEGRVVYCASRKECDNLAAMLRRFSVRAQAYHAGMEGDARHRVQDDFMEDRTECVVATNAFGMGLDKSNIRLVAHWNLPESIYAYVQESGRGGRDGKDATCLLNIEKGGLRVREFLIRVNNPPFWVYEKLWRFLLRNTPHIKATLRVSEDTVNSEVGGIQGWGTAALRFLEYTRHLVTLPGVKAYNLPVKDLAKAKRLARQYDAKVAHGVVRLVCQLGGIDPVNEFIVSGATRYAPPTTSVILRRTSPLFTMEERMVQEKQDRDMEKLRDVVRFADAEDKVAFINSRFL